MNELCRPISIGPLVLAPRLQPPSFGPQVDRGHLSPLFTTHHKTVFVLRPTSSVWMVNGSAYAAGEQLHVDWSWRRPPHTDIMRCQIARAMLLLCLAFLWANTGIDAVATGAIGGMLALRCQGRCAPRSRPLPQRCLSRLLHRIVRRHDCRRRERHVRRHHRRQSRLSMAKVLMLTVFVIQVSNRPCTYRSTFRAHSKYFFYYDSTDWSGGRLFSAVRRRWGSHAPFISRDGRCYRARNSCSRHSEPEPPPAYEGRSTAIS